MMHNGNNGDNGNNGNILFARVNRVEEIYDVILGAGCIVFSILALVQLLMATINKFVNYYSRQIDRIVMDESFDDSDDDSEESDYSEYSESESSQSECSECQYDDIKLSPYVPPRRSERLAENRARCNSPVLICRLKFD